jgi:hypothetical protein
VLRKDLICELQKHKYVSLLDASTDKADTEDLILYVRYITDKVEFFYQSSPSSVLLQMEIFRLFNRNWKSLGLNWVYSCQLIGMGTDGAASLIGVQNGFVQKVCQNLSRDKYTLHRP